MRASELIEQLGGKDALDTLGQAVGMGRGQAASMVDAVAPMLLRGLQHRTETDDGLVSFRDALRTGNHGRYLEQPEVLTTEDAVHDGRRILGHILGDHRIPRNVANEAASRTGFDMSVIEKALPMVAGLVMAALSKHTNAGRDLGTSASQASPLGPLKDWIDQDHDGSVLDDIIGMASRYI